MEPRQMIRGRGSTTEGILSWIDGVPFDVGGGFVRILVRVPPGPILGGAAIFMGLTDAVTIGKLGYYFFPNANAVILLFLMVPLAVVMSTEWNVFISSRVSDVRIAQQIGIILALPLFGIYLAAQANLVSLGDANTLLTLSGALLLVDLLFLYVAHATFRREAILTKWK